MAFNKKVWKNRISENPLRRMITNITTGVSEIIDVTRYEGVITEAGDAFSAANMNDLENRIEQGINDAGSSDIIAGIEETDTASKAYTVNQYLIYNKKLYRVTSAIAVGNTLVPNVNIVEKKLADELSNHLVVNGNAFYFDVHDGEYGYNTSESRGADTFVPFKRSADNVAYVHILGSTGATSVSTNYTLPKGKGTAVLFCTTYPYSANAFTLTPSSGTATLLANKQASGGGAYYESATYSIDSSDGATLAITCTYGYTGGGAPQFMLCYLY